MASHGSVPVTRIAGLKRAERLAGESFGYEDVFGLSDGRRSEWQSSRWLWWGVAILAAVGLGLLHFS